MPLPNAIRTRVPDRIRDHPAIRAAALAAGLVPPRPMHLPAEAAVLRRFAQGARCVVELGVYEGSSAFVFCDVLRQPAELHLVDPFVDETGAAMRAGWHGTPFATRWAVRRRVEPGGPSIHWHIARSQDVGRGWTGPPVDLVFIDGDHSERGCREDWDVWHPHVRPGGTVAFHDARDASRPGPTAVVDELFRVTPVDGWELCAEVDTMVVVRRL